jgi:hypothetical protein
LLVVGGLILFTDQSNRLADTQATVTAQSNTLVAGARAGTQLAAGATQAAESNDEAAAAGAATQSSLQENLSTSQAEAARTQSALEAEADQANATQAALADELAAREAVATRAAQTQSALADDLATRRAEATDLHITATRYAILRVEAATDAAATASSLEQAIAALEANATQFVTTSANQSAMVAAAVTAQAESGATITALERDLATALAQPGDMVPTESAVARTPVATGAVLDEATPVANVEVGSVGYHELYNQDTSWFLGEVENAGNASLVDGQYVVTIDVVPSTLTAFSPQTIADGYAEVEVDLRDCPPDSLFGLFMRVQEEASGGYFFAFPCNLSFWAIVAFQDGVQPQVLNSNSLPGPTTARQHTIGVMMAGSTLSLYLDGEELGSATDNTFQDGVIGVYGETLNGELVLRFDNFRVWDLP